jgi:hypothetical protein
MIAAVPPLANVWTKIRWAPTLTYLQYYAQNHRDWGGEFFVCIYDGWREYTEFVPNDQRIHLPWSEVDHRLFTGTGMANEPRFFHRHRDKRIWPVLPRPVIAYDRLIDDHNVLLIPDAEFLSTGFSSFVDQVRASDIPFTEKSPKAVWRGSRLSLDNRSYYDLARNSARFRDVIASASTNNPIIDASYEKAPISWMLKHRYQLDIDGTVNAWSGFYWKLSSNSVVFKIASHWEQWYYDQLVPDDMYVPVATIADIPERVRACEEDPQLCQAISQRARDFVRTLTYRYAIEQYAIC